jgi:hypothetical protein
VSGLAVTVAPVVVFKPVDGDQVYEPPVAPLAVKTTPVPPKHISDGVGLTKIVGGVCAVIV